MRTFFFVTALLCTLPGFALADEISDAMNAPMGSDGEAVFEIDSLGMSLRQGRSFQKNARTGGRSCAIQTPVINVQVMGLGSGNGQGDVIIYSIGSGFAVSGWNTGMLEVGKATRGVKGDLKAKIDLSNCNVCVQAPGMAQPSCR